MGNLFSFIFLTFPSFSFIFLKLKRRSTGGGAFGTFWAKLVMAHHFLGAPLVTEKNWFRIFFQNMIRNMTRKFEILFQNFIMLMNMNKFLDINKV